MTIRLVISPGKSSPLPRNPAGPGEIRKLFNGVDKPRHAVLWMGRFVRRAHRKPGGGSQYASGAPPRGERGQMEQAVEESRTILESVCVVCLGHVGGPMARYFARHGFPTYGCDINPQAASGLGYTLLQSSTSLAELPLADVFIVTVDTGFRGEEPITANVFKACGAIRARGTPKLVSIESTVPVGTCRRVHQEVFGGRQRLVPVPPRRWGGDGGRPRAGPQAGRGGGGGGGRARAGAVCTSGGGPRRPTRA